MELSLANCARCGGLYRKIRSSVCPKCQDAEDADYEKVRDALCYEPDLTFDQVAEIAGVEPKCVLRMLNEDRFSTTLLADPPICGRCGAPAISRKKRLCESCLRAMDLEFAEALRKIHAAQQDRQDIRGVHPTFIQKRRT
ncbi:MAG TPA: hypothetical protein HPP77_00885 [Candidatus Hydrogenedentes bacterium]|nr:hypothetical protein [Candidatus Hydrogenedentota bacterium]